MTRKRRIVLTVVPVVLVLMVTAAFLLFLPKSRGYREDLRFAEVERGDIRNSIACTGTLSPRGTVEVGTQVSGTVLHVYADYNDTVEKDQVLAVLDTALLEIAVQQAEADVAKTAAQYALDQKNYENNKLLYEKKLISDYDFETIKVTRANSYAAKITAENNLKKARSNLSYAIIRSPIDGIVIDREVEEGQTVAASYSTPTLFTIARDLSGMEIDALVDESDIGSIEEKQPAEFTVDAYPDETFQGTVVQVRLQPVTVSNVVNYHVILEAENREHHLLPGMTATIDIVTEESKDVLCVPNSALQIRPTAEMTEEIRQAMAARRAGPDADGNDGSPVPLAGENGKKGEPPDFLADKASRPAFASTVRQDGNIGMLWFLDDTGSLKAVPVRTGISDGQNTEVSGSPAVKEGLEVIAGINSAQNTDTDSPAMGGRRMGGGPPPLF